jgi:hypothetical protein
VQFHWASSMISKFHHICFHSHHTCKFSCRNCCAYIDDPHLAVMPSRRVGYGLTMTRATNW